MGLSESKRNLAGWIGVAMISVAAALFIFLAPDFNSGDSDAPTLATRLINLVAIFLVSGALLLPVRVNSRSIRLNQVIVALGAIAMLAGLVRGFISMPKNFSQDGILLGWGFFGLMLCALVFAVIKLRKSVA